MKAILMSIRPEWVAKILNGEKTIEIRKKFPKDYVGWVYIYCTKNRRYANIINRGGFLTGMVVARFWCNKVKEHKDFDMFPYRALRFNKATCLSEEDLEDYGFVEGKGYVPLYAIHITKLEIFDKPKELKEFSKKEFDSFITGQIEHYKCPLNRAPQSWQFIEV